MYKNGTYQGLGALKWQKVLNELLSPSDDLVEIQWLKILRPFETQ